MFMTRRAAHCLLIALALCGIVSSVASARNATVTTKDGRQFMGEVDAENEKGIKLFISGISTLISRQDIRDVQYELTVSEEFQQRRKLIKDDDLDGRYKLAYWLYDKKSYGMAQKELSTLASQFPEDGRIKSLRELVANRIKLHKTPTPPKPTKMPDVKDKFSKSTSPSATGIIQKDKYNRLSKEQINLIKVYEIDLTKTREPRIHVPREVVDDFLEEYADKDKSLRGQKSQQTFRRWSGARQLRKMFQLRARDFYARAEVREDPAAMALFKKSVHRTYVLNYCGTTRCHGGPDAGEFKLIPFKQTSNETVYTNFFLINSWKRGEGYMLDRDKVDESYLIQYGLPHEGAKYPHPKNVKGWQPNLIGRSNTMKRNLLEWIGELYRPAPEYPIAFNLLGENKDEDTQTADSKLPKPQVKETSEK